MKTKKSDLIVAIIITLLVVILTGLLIAWMTGMFKDKKKDIDNGTEKIDGAIGSMAEFDLLVYDGDTIGGERLVELISDFDMKDVQVSIWVHTLDNKDEYYNYEYTDDNLGTALTTIPPTGKATAGYITPSAKFLGKVLKNTNGEIVCLSFTQQK